MPSKPPSSLETVNTPCLVLDWNRLTRNLDRMARWVGARHVRLRPHLKTSKSIDIARLVAPDRNGPVAVSTLLEAEYFFGHGYRDIYYAVGLGPGKFRRAAELLRQGADLLTSVDDPNTAARLAAFADRENVRFRTLIEIDCGDLRTGIPPASPLVVETARALGANFAGVTSHAGQSYSCRGDAERNAVALAEANAVREVAAGLAQAGFKAQTVCIGSSPTALAQIDLTGVTDVLAGVYMFGDLFQASIATCGMEDLAVTVLAEVISRPRHRPTEFLIDAGTFALSKDFSTAALPPRQRTGFGLVADLDGTQLPGLKVERLWQEHGLVVSEQPLPLEVFPVGTRLRILPNHVCITAGAYSSYTVVKGGRAVIAEWPRINGW